MGGAAAALYRRELLKGNTETLLLSLLSAESMYGYQIVREIERAAAAATSNLKEGTLYPALRRLERDGLIEGVWKSAPSGHDRRYYHMTAKGRSGLRSLLKEWDLLTKAVNLVAQSVFGIAVVSLVVLFIPALFDAQRGRDPGPRSAPEAVQQHWPDRCGVRCRDRKPLRGHRETLSHHP